MRANATIIFDVSRRVQPAARRPINMIRNLVMAAYAVTGSKDGVQPLTPKSRLDTLFSVMRITDLRRSELELPKK